LIYPVNQNAVCRPALSAQKRHKTWIATDWLDGRYFLHCPRAPSSGGKDRLGSISKQGDRYLRSLFVAGALSVIRYAKAHGNKHRRWLTALLARRPAKVAAIALANKLARMAWAMMTRGASGTGTRSR
jgi:hypothetical protein